MTNEQITLARRAVACKGWRWMPGMAVVSKMGPCRVASSTSAYSFVGSYLRETKTRPYASTGWSYLEHTQGGIEGFIDTMPLPDLTDPATLGCLLALVREAWIRPSTSSMCWGDYWDVTATKAHDDHTCSSDLLGSGDTEAEALVAALEAAP